MNDVPPILRRSNDWNAALALAGLGFSAALGSPLPSALLGFGSLMTFLFACRPRQKRMGGLGVANALTLVRLLITLAVSMVSWRTPWHFAIGAGVVLVLDGVDGWAARRLGEASLFGAYFDMETDAYLILMLCLVLYLAGGVGAWALIPGSLRYVFVVVRRLQGVKQMRERRSRFGRIAFLTLALSLLLACVPGLHTISVGLVAVGLLVVSISFSGDFRALIQAARAGVQRG